MLRLLLFIFFFQAEDGIRDDLVTGVQTCALPISKSIRSLRDLDGKTVSVDLPNGGTFVTALTVFERLGMKPKVVYIEQRIALEKLKAGEIDTVIVSLGKPYKSITTFKHHPSHFMP